MSIIGLKGIVVTMDRGLKLLHPGSVIIDSQRGTIVDVGRDSLIREYKPEIVYGGENKIIMPGLINTHTHSPMSLFRGFVSEVSGMEWLKRVWSVEAYLKPRHVYVGALLSIISMVKSGTTTFADHYFYAEEVARAVIETGVRAVIAKTVIEYPREVAKHTLSDSIRFAKEWKSVGRVSTMIGIHSLYTCNIDTVVEAVEASIDYSIPIHLHLSESRDELEIVRRKYGTTPIRLAKKLNVLGTKHLLAHVAYVTDVEEMKVLGDLNAKVAYAPFTKMRGGQEIAPIVDMLNVGVSVSLSTDGPLSCGDLDMFKEMKFMLAAQNIKYRSPSAVKPVDVLKAATVNAARNLGLENVIGSIRAGKRADIIVVDASKPKAIPVRDPYYTILYCISGSDVETVIVDGKPILVNHKLTTLNEEKVVKEALKTVDELQDILLEGASS